MYRLHIRLVGGHTVVIDRVTDYTVVAPRTDDDGSYHTWEIGFDLADDSKDDVYIDRRAIVAVEVETIEPDAAA